MQIIGHRGTGVTMRHTKAQENARRMAGTQAPENTLAAFEMALKGGADGIELDVIRTADNDLAIIHDESLEKHHIFDSFKAAAGFAGDYKMAQLRRMNAGDGEGIPSLRDVFALAKKYGAPLLNIDLRRNDTYDIALRQVILSGYPPEKILFSSFDHEMLQKLRELDSSVQIGLLFRRQDFLRNILLRQPCLTERYLNKVAEKIKPFSLHPHIEDATEPVIARAKNRLLSIFAWTSDEKPPSEDPKALAFALRYKEDSHVNLITDYPVAIRAALLPKAGI